MQAVAKGRADIAAIDAISWRIIAAHDPAARRLKVIGTTGATPGQALITARGNDPAPIRKALNTALTALAPADRKTLGLAGLTDIPLAAYLGIPTPPGPGQHPSDLPES